MNVPGLGVSAAKQAARQAIRRHVLDNPNLGSLAPMVGVNAEWFTIELPADGARSVPGTSYGALLANAVLLGNAKWCLVEGQLRLRADIPLSGLGTERIDDAVASAAAAIIGTPSTPGTSPQQDKTRDVTDDRSIDAVIDTLRFEHGWHSSSRSDGSVVFELLSLGATGHAVLATMGDGYRISTSVLRDPLPSDNANATSVSTFLLCCTGSIRGCRAMLNNNHIAELETTLPSGFSNVEAHHALTSLSLAVSIARPPARVLASNAVLAKVYSANGYVFPDDKGASTSRSSNAQRRVQSPNPH